jgi:peptidoglycan/LPS O-acetylase OafA/YrhL
LSRQQIHLGRLAVDGFFALSGFLIADSWLLSDGFIAFFRKRALRIYPAFLVVSAVCLLLFGPLAADDPRLYLRGASYFAGYTFRAATLQPISIPGVLGHVPVPGEINWSTWTIQFEWWCYLGLAVLGSTGVLRRRGLVTALLIACFTLYALQEHHVGGLDRWPAFFAWGLLPVPLGMEWPRLATFFLGGVWFYLYRERIPYSCHVFYAALLVLAISAAAGHGLSLVLPAFGIYSLFYVAFNRRLKLTRLTPRSDISYGSYLYAYPIQQLIILHWGALLNPYTLMFAACLITGLFAWLSWRFVEEPCLKLKPGACARNFSRVQRRKRAQCPPRPYSL